MYEILIGRDDEDKKKYGQEGMFLLGKHYVQMNQTTSLSNEILVDAIRPHVIFVCGKRGSGKSYTLAAIAEGIFELDSNIKNNICIIMIDTMGIYWTMKYKNTKDQALLEEWEIEEKTIPLRTYIPQGFYKNETESELNLDKPFSIKTSEITPADWITLFELEDTNAESIIITKTISELKNKNYDINEIIQAITEQNFDERDKTKTKNLFTTAKAWGIFSKEGIEISQLLKGGTVNVIDISCYTNATNSNKIKALVTGLLSEKIFKYKMELRRIDELNEIKEEQDFGDITQPKKSPVAWIMIDEAHEMLPKTGSTPATKALLTLLREGRQPGISLILASQQPGQIHTDVMTQSDIVIAHRLTAKIDTDSLGLLMQTYLRENLDKSLLYLPDVKGAAIIFDDVNEKLYQARIRPRMTWHGGSSPTAIQERKKTFSFIIE